MPVFNSTTPGFDTTRVTLISSPRSIGVSIGLAIVILLILVFCFGVFTCLWNDNRPQRANQSHRFETIIRILDKFPGAAPQFNSKNPRLMFQRLAALLFSKQHPGLPTSSPTIAYNVSHPFNTGLSPFSISLCTPRLPPMAYTGMNFPSLLAYNGYAHLDNSTPYRLSSGNPGHIMERPVLTTNTITENETTPKPIAEQAYNSMTVNVAVKNHNAIVEEEENKEETTVCHTLSTTTHRKQIRAASTALGAIAEEEEEEDTTTASMLVVPAPSATKLSWKSLPPPSRGEFRQTRIRLAVAVQMAIEALGNITEADEPEENTAVFSNLVVNRDTRTSASAVLIASPLFKNTTHKVTVQPVNKASKHCPPSNIRNRVRASSESASHKTIHPLASGPPHHKPLNTVTQPPCRVITSHSMIGTNQSPKTSKPALLTRAPTPPCHVGSPKQLGVASRAGRVHQPVDSPGVFRKSYQKSIASNKQRLQKENISNTSAII